MELLEGYMVDLFHISKTLMFWIFCVNGRKEKKEDLPQSSGSCRIVVPGRQKKQIFNGEGYARVAARLTVNWLVRS